MPPVSPSPLRALLIYNPDAGRSLAAGRVPIPLPPVIGAGKSGAGNIAVPRWLEETLSYLRVASGVEVAAVAAQSFDHAAQTARAAAQTGADLVIAAGGDGTLRAVAEGLTGTKTAMGILPRGTVNVLAREFGIPLDDPTRALDICLGGKTRAIDLGRIGNRYFLLMCSVGFDALTVGNVNPEVKGVVGASAYVLAAVATLATYTPPEMTLILDGEPRATGPTFMVVVANAPTYGGDFRLAPEADMGDGLLDVCVFEAPAGPLPVQRAAFIRQIGAVALGRHLQDPDVQFYRARRIELYAAPQTSVQIDGDALGATPLTVEVAPGALSVRAPD